MPQKTRKEKLLAQQRRATRASPLPPSVSTPQPHQEPREIKYSLPSLSAVPHTSIQRNDTAELSYIKRDLLTTMILAAMAIGIELALYFRWEFHR